MTVEMNEAEMKKFYEDTPGLLPIHSGSNMFGWRSFRLTPEELTRLEILENNLDARGAENVKYFSYVSRMTGIPLDTIDTTVIQHEVLTVMPIVYRTGRVLE